MCAHQSVALFNGGTGILDHATANYDDAGEIDGMTLWVFLGEDSLSAWSVGATAPLHIDEDHWHRGDEQDPQPRGYRPGFDLTKMRLQSLKPVNADTEPHPGPPDQPLQLYEAHFSAVDGTND